MHEVRKETSPYYTLLWQKTFETDTVPVTLIRMVQIKPRSGIHISWWLFLKSLFPWGHWFTNNKILTLTGRSHPIGHPSPPNSTVVTGFAETENGETLPKRRCRRETVSGPLPLRRRLVLQSLNMGSEGTGVLTSRLKSLYRLLSYGPFLSNRTKIRDRTITSYNSVSPYTFTMVGIRPRVAPTETYDIEGVGRGHGVWRFFD